MATANQQLSLGNGHRDRVAAAMQTGDPDEIQPRRALGCLGILPVCNPGEVGQEAGGRRVGCRSCRGFHAPSYLFR